jgi:hypothetical protein
MTFRDSDRTVLEIFTDAHDDYVSASPYPHAVFQDLFDPSLIKAAAAEFPPLAHMERSFDAPTEQKSSESRWSMFGPATKQLIAELNSGPFVEALQALIGIKGLITDAHLVGGGMHQIGRGGWLKVHADFNKIADRTLDRRINLILYLNEDWHPEWGGQLQLWDRDMAAAVKSIEPAANTTVVFSTTSTSFHGHPDPLQCPAERSRKSIALYYYSNGREDGQTARHHTLWQSLPGERVPSRFRVAMSLFRRGARLLLPEKLARTRPPS